MDISQLSDKWISKLASIYLHATIAFDVPPLEASARTQKKIRKWIGLLYIEWIHELPQDVDPFSLEHSDREVLSFLKACLDRQNALENEKEAAVDAALAALDAPARSALKQLLKLDCWPTITVVGDDAKIVLDDTPAFRRVLTLQAANGVPNGREGHFCEDLGIADREDGRLCVYGELEDPSEETTAQFALTFERAVVEVESYNACSVLTFWNDPWDLLRTIGFGIRMKAELPGAYCNEKERVLLPLIKEIVALEYWMELPEQERFSFGELKARAHRYGYTAVVALLDTLETLKPSDGRYRKTARQLIATLCQASCAPLWREVYDQLAASQAAYPDKAESLCDNALLTDARHEIQAYMEAKGYSGTYPDFVKHGALNGIHLEHSYNMTYFVGMEKRAQYHIHCTEDFGEDDCLTIGFLCGTALLKKRDNETDVYDCLFNAKGRRLFRTMHHYIPLQNEDDIEPDDLETSVTIATKKAECIKLTKAEQQAFYGNALPGFGMFLSIFVVGGGLFSIAMTLIGMLFCIVVAVVFGLFSEIPEMLKEIPWGPILAFGWIGFGGAMGITEVLAHRK